jgi:hypothetical protein
MTTFVSGPMFEPSTSALWESVACSLCRTGRSGAHYNTFGVRTDRLGMQALRAMFPGGKANEMNFAVFSTSGVHGMYTTIEEAEAAVARGDKDEDGEDWEPSVTFLVVQPRIVCLRYGNCHPRTAEDFAFLRQLRASSWAAVQLIGASDKEGA